MAWEQRDMSGSLFKNQRPMGDKSAQYTGSALIDGKERWVSAWVKKDKNGNNWISLSFKDKQPMPTKQEPSQSSRAIDLDEDEIPF